MTVALNPAQRASDLVRARTGEFDVVVVGGGVTGAGCALDAAARGLSVLLLEAGDLAGGTSSRSGKTLHGGLRYLEQLNFGLVHSAIVERDLQVKRLAPYLTRAEKFLYPLTHAWERPYVGAGVAIYDLFGLRGRGVPRHRHLSRTRLRTEAPALDLDLVRGGIQYFDVRIDDARHTLMIARTAAVHGAAVLTHARTVAVHRAADRVIGVSFIDEQTGGLYDVRARAVINAAGAWAAEVQQLAGAHTFTVRPAKGVHLLVPRDAVDSRTGILARATDSVIIIRKWFDHWLIGTTDTPWTGPLDNPVADSADVDYLLGNINRYLRRDIRRSDVVGVYAGVRPLLAPAGQDGATTSALSRDHAVIAEPMGFVTIVGGKYTTYRAMAADAVDAAARDLGQDVPVSPTAALPLVGTDGWSGASAAADRIAADHGLTVAEVHRLLDRYGGLVGEVLRPVGANPALSRPLAGTNGYLAAEFRYAVSHEGATSLRDVLERRTHVSVEASDGGLSAAPAVAQLIAPLLGWDGAELHAQVVGYAAHVDRERAALAGV